eukprot:m.91229 g.91229  ORF g.91229 m.91229 type:complete len:196 (+) comp21634_c1_seq2:41-628(+)
MSFRKEPWFHGSVPRGVAEKRLQNAAIGTFLFRESESRPGFSLSVKVPNKIKHFMVSKKQSGKIYLVGKPSEFDELEELVDFHRTTATSTSDGTCLLFPCPQEDPPENQEEEESAYVPIINSPVNADAKEAAHKKFLEKQASITEEREKIRRESNEGSLTKAEKLRQAYEDVTLEDLKEMGLTQEEVTRDEEEQS